MRGAARKALERLLSIGNVKLVSSQWGPRGAAASFQAIRAAGVSPSVVFDIGAAKGTWTQEIYPIFPDATYVLVDPLPENVKALSDTASKSRNVRVISAAVGSVQGKLELFVHGDQSSFLRSDSFSGERVKVPVMTCDEILGEVAPSLEQPARLLLKIDVQGYELEVLRGAVRALDSTDVLLVEVSVQRIYEGNPLAHEVIAHLGALGFCIYDIASYVQRPHDKALTQVDLVFVRQTSPLMSYVGWR